MNSASGSKDDDAAKLCPPTHTLEASSSRSSDAAATDVSGGKPPSSSRQIADEKAEISKITDYLYLSGCTHLDAAAATRALGLTCAINCVRGIAHAFPPAVEYVVVPLDDEEGQPLAPYVDVVNAAIDRQRRAGGRCLVYCGLGISRSASLVIAYLMHRHTMTLVDAYRYVQVRRTIVCPNVGFFRQLLAMEHRLYQTTTVTIIEPAPGVLVPDVVWAEIYAEVMHKMSHASIN